METRTSWSINHKIVPLLYGYFFTKEVFGDWNVIRIIGIKGVLESTSNRRRNGNEIV